MYLFPYKKIFLETELSQEKAIEQLRKEIEPIKFARNYLTDGKSFEGKIDNFNFDLRIPPISKSDSYNPQISGNITENNHKAQIFLIFGLNKFVLFFLSLLYILFLGVFLSILIHFRITLNDLKFLGIFSLLYVYVMYFWNRGFDITLSKLVTIFHAHPVSKKGV